ncbi:MAG: proline dehydrogenase, partial [Deltaproteobacteria bacterium]|nr:proline dehydrogenase [Deltaproteobacteria bacterium]
MSAGAAFLARVRSVVRAARALGSATDPLGAEARRRLPASSGLSPEGVELALAHYLETDPSPGELAELVAAAGAAPRGRCAVVLASTVCTAALRALAFAAACAPELRIRPSRRDPVVAELLVRALGDSEGFARAGGRAVLCPTSAPLGELVAEGDELHLYGSDASLAAILASLPPGVRVRAFGTGLGVAALERGAILGEAAAALARDVVVFDQRGCLSPRFCLVEGGPERAEGLAVELHAALCRLGEKVPRGPLGPAERAELSRFELACQALGRTWSGPHHAVGLDLEPHALALGPAARAVLVAACEAPAAAGLLAPFARYVTAIGGTSGAEAGGLVACLQAIAPPARRSPLGRMHMPPLDG